MAMQPNVENLIEAAKLLAPEDQQRLVQSLVRQSQAQQHSITEMRGLGKELWRDMDAQCYVDAERDSWAD